MMIDHDEDQHQDKSYLSRSNWPYADLGVSVVGAKLTMMKITMMKICSKFFLDISVQKSM